MAASLLGAATAAVDELALGGAAEGFVVALTAVAALTIGSVGGLLAAPAFAVGFVAVSAVRDAAYDPPRGSSGIDALGPMDGVTLVLPAYLALVLIGATVSWVGRRRRSSGDGRTARRRRSVARNR